MSSLARLALALIASAALVNGACEFASTAVCTSCTSTPSTCSNTIVTYCNSVSWSETACRTVSVACPFAATASAGTASPCQVAACVGTSTQLNETACVSAIVNYCSSQTYLASIGGGYTRDSACANVSIPTIDQIAVILDSETAGVATLTGVWSNSSSNSLAFRGLLYFWTSAKTNTATWTYTFPTSGRYSLGVSVQGGTTRASNVVYSITHALGTTNVTVNQQTVTAEYVSLGNYHFTAGFQGRVFVSTAGTNGIVTVDALQIREFIDTSGADAQDTITLDNDSSGVIVSSTGWTVTTSTTISYQGANYLFGTSTAASIQWVPTFNQRANYEVYVTFAGHSTRTSNASYVVTHRYGTTRVGVDQRVTTGAWVSIGTYTFSQGSTGRVSLSPSSSGGTTADAVRWILRPVSPIIRDNEAATDVAISAFWSPQITGTAYRYGTSFLFSSSVSASVVYTFALTTGATYEVFTTYAGSSNRSPSVPYTVRFPNGTSVVRSINQVTAITSPVSIGFWTFPRGTTTVTISAPSDGKVFIADSVQFALYEPNNPQASIFIDAESGVNVVRSLGWTAGTSSLAKGSSFFYASSTAAQLEYDPVFEGTATYNVLIFYVSASNRTPVARHEIGHASGTAIVLVDQTVACPTNGFSLGTYTFNRGTTGYVKVSLGTQTGVFVTADAIQFVRV